MNWMIELKKFPDSVLKVLPGCFMLLIVKCEGSVLKEGLFNIKGPGIVGLKNTQPFQWQMMLKLDMAFWHMLNLGYSQKNIP